MENLNPNRSNMSNTKSVDQIMSIRPSRMSQKVLNFHKNQDQVIDSFFLTQPSNNGFTVFHQNIRCFQNKTEELLNSLSSNPPQILCLTRSSSKI
jgi:hypothetical protein